MYHRLGVVFISLMLILIFISCGTEKLINEVNSLATNGIEPEDNNSIPIKEANKDGSKINKNEFYQDIENFNKLFSMPSADVINWLGDDYRIVLVGIEYDEEGYQYEQYGITIRFGSIGNSDAINVIYCSDIVDICGARIGMTFSQILDYLPESEVFEIRPIEPDDPTFALIHEYEKIIIWFGASEENGKTTKLEIRRNNRIR